MAQQQEPLDEPILLDDADNASNSSSIVCAVEKQPQQQQQLSTTTSDDRNSNKSSSSNGTKTSLTTATAAAKKRKFAADADLLDLSSNCCCRCSSSSSQSRCRTNTSTGTTIEQQQQQNSGATIHQVHHQTNNLLLEKCLNETESLKDSMLTQRSDMLQQQTHILLKLLDVKDDVHRLTCKMHLAEMNVLRNNNKNRLSSSNNDGNCEDGQNDCRAADVIVVERNGNDGGGGMAQSHGMTSSGGRQQQQPEFDAAAIMAHLFAESEQQQRASAEREHSLLERAQQQNQELRSELQAATLLTEQRGEEIDKLQHELNASRQLHMEQQRHQLELHEHQRKRIEELEHVDIKYQHIGQEICVVTIADNEWMESEQSAIGLVFSHEGNDYRTVYGWHPCTKPAGLRCGRTQFLFYYEVKVLKTHKGGIYIGLCSADFPLENCYLGGHKNSYAITSYGDYRSEGKCRKQFTGTFGRGDVIGCGLVTDGVGKPLELFFTRNGQLMEKRISLESSAEETVPELFPAVTLWSVGPVGNGTFAQLSATAKQQAPMHAEIKANFGRETFRYDPAGYLPSREKTPILIVIDD